MSGSKVKGILKGLRYISQIFDNEKEQDIQIGYPTDVKHVAHIGWDGPSVNSPSWMNEFKTSPGFSSAPLSLTGDVQNMGQDSSVKWVSKDSSRRSSRHVNSPGQGRDLSELPKASRRPSSTGSITDSPTKERSDRPRQSRKSSKAKDPLDGSPARILPDIPKKSRRKKSKDNSSNGGGSSKLRSKAQQPSDSGSPSGSVSKSRNKQRSLEENEQYEQYESGVSGIP